MRCISRGLGAKNIFQLCFLLPLPFQTPGQYSDTMTLPSCPCASVYSQMPGRCYNPEQVSVCQINGKSYWSGTIIQTHETTDQLDYLAEVVLQNRRGLDLLAQRLKLLTAMRETWVRSLGREDSLEKEMATHSSILAWRIPWTEEPVGLQSMGSQRAGHD